MADKHSPLIAGSGGSIEVNVLDNPRDRTPVAMTACTCTIRTVPLAGAAASTPINNEAGDIPGAGVVRLQLSAGQIAALAAVAPATLETQFRYTVSGEVEERRTPWIRLELLA